VETKIADAVYW